MQGKCLNCEVEFSKTRPWQKFCSQECRTAYWEKGHPRVTTNSHTVTTTLQVICQNCIQRIHISKGALILVAGSEEGCANCSE